MAKGEQLKIAVPSIGQGGLDSQVSDHFGHTETFTIVTIESNEITGSEALPNPPHTQGGCMAPVMLLKKFGAEAIIVTGIGMRPMMGFQQMGMKVFSGVPGTVENAVREYLKGNLKQAGEDVLCQH